MMFKEWHRAQARQNQFRWRIAGVAMLLMVGSLLLVVAVSKAATPSIGTTVAIVDATTPVQQATVSTAGALKVDGSAVTQPVSGTVTATIDGADPCVGALKSVKPINNAASATSLLLVTGVASQKVYVCGINIGPVAAVSVGLVEGTTTTTACDTGTAGLAGGATAATGWVFSAGGSVAHGGSNGTVAATATAANHVCLLFSAAVQVSGVMSYVQQ